ncbi:hypothetical protein SAMN05443633_108114 [Chryseobacterium arachidis]|uniref:Uncharacterized protein n=1 Tax=Chryseobacterium arachidis TaxID=1416778 RepID=A0A1M5FRV0_9FLAO|nr:hypothetical protein [Chryseobacterium arachidis]SHF94228.1 hypothetical protein SAMN05443633_108114 [Chryseobacterium arachidis]
MKNILQYRRLIDRYLILSVKSQFNLELDLTGEYTFAENLVSKKIIVATTFTERIFSKPSVKLFLSSLIAELNYEKCSISFIKSKLRALKKGQSGQNIKEELSEEI